MYGHCLCYFWSESVDLRSQRGTLTDAPESIFMPFFQSVGAGLLAVLLAGGLVGLLSLLGRLVCKKSWPCQSCQLPMDNAKFYTDWGLVFKCPHCEGRNVV